MEDLPNQKSHHRYNDGHLVVDLRHELVMLDSQVLWRNYSTYQQISISVCPSGSYFSQGGNSRTTVLESQERRSFSDQGTWSVSELGNRVVVQSRSVSGQVTAFLVHLLSSGRIWAGSGISVSPMGPASCS